MFQPGEFIFKIDLYTPETFPMERLAVYMADLAAMFGEQGQVHFVRLEDGSTAIVSKIDGEALPKVRDRISRIKRREAEPETQAAYERINRKLRDDNGSGDLWEDDTVVIPFPGKKLEESLTFGAFNQEGSLDGRIMRLGGTREPAYVLLKSSDMIYGCEARREMIKRLREYLYEGEIRLFGTGRWQRNKIGEWELRRFVVRDFIPLDDTPLSEVINSLRRVEGSEWNTVEDPWEELNTIRHGGGNEVS